jgi:hypothetical protein
MCAKHLLLLLLLLLLLKHCPLSSWISLADNALVLLFSPIRNLTLSFFGTADTRLE